MSYWKDLTEEECKDLVDDLNAIEKKYVDLLNQAGAKISYSFIPYRPATQTLQQGPLPKYIPSKKTQIEEPPLVYGPPARFRPNREDKISKKKRELALQTSIIETEGSTPERIEKQNQIIRELNEIRREYRKKRKINKAIKKKWRK